jgi:anti-anti-sigma factor
MADEYRYLTVQQRGNQFCAQLTKYRLEEQDIYVFANEMVAMIDKDGSRHVVLDLGGDNLDCLFSMFLAKLMMIRRMLNDLKGSFKLCNVSDDVRGVFKATNTDSYFTFYPDLDTALASQ